MAGCNGEKIKVAIPQKALISLVADVAELADALDSKFHFHRFQRAASRFNRMDKTPDSIG
jgi:hypothetical protein